MPKIRAVVLDTDGTLALHTEEERAHYDYSKVRNDRPNKPIIEIAQRIIMPDMGELSLQPLVVTGRADENNGQVRRDTRDWYNEHVFYIEDYELFMRKEFLPSGKRDFRPDDIVKKEIYVNDIEPYYDVVLWVDDRPRVLRMLHSLGIPTLASKHFLDRV